MDTGTQDLLISATVQFGGVTAATWALTEYMPIFRMMGVKPPYGRRLSAVLYAIFLSAVAWTMGLVNVPQLKFEGIGAEIAVVCALGVISTVLAHVASEKIKNGGTG